MDASLDLGRWTVAFNWINETDLRRDARGFTDFGYAFGVSRALSGTVAPFGGDVSDDAAHGRHHRGRWWRPRALGFEMYVEF